jgi:hypothetical protein
VKATVLAITLLAAAAPLALADDALVHDTCVMAEAALDYATCSGAASGNAQVQVFPTQTTLECVERKQGGTECTYAPRYHARIEGALPGDWVLRATHLVRNLSTGDVVPGSERTLSCVASGLGTTCAAEDEAPHITARLTSSVFRWEGSWALALVDPTGAEHVTAAGGATCIIAQYYPCEGSV